MRVLLYLTTVIFFLAPTARAQMAQEQRMHWFYLQKLATDIKELELCNGNDPAVKKVEQALYLRRDELAKAIEDYVNRYPAGRGDHETVPAFRFRVWDVALKVGTEKARPRSELSEGMCSVLATTF